MKLSTKGRYGLRALIDLAQFSANDEAVSISAVAGRQNISEGYLEQIFSLLKKAGLIAGKRGAGGGYTLAKPASEISVGDILRALEGSLEAVDCAGIKENSNCGSSDVCVTKYVWQRINESINHAVDEIKLDQLIENSIEAQKAAGTDKIVCE